VAGVKDEDVVLVLGCGSRAYREYLLAAAAGRHPLWMFNGAPVDWPHRYVQGTTVVDLDDHEAVLAAARDLAWTRPIAGVVSWDEAAIVTAAQVAHELGLPGPGLDGIEGCKDKARSRRVLTAAGLAQPRFAFTLDEASALAAAAEIGYPVIVKPRAAGASIGVVLAPGPDAVRTAFRDAEAFSRNGNRQYVGGALVEEYLSGPEISIDGAVADGVYEPMFVAHKRIGMRPYFEEIGHTVDAADVLLSDRRLGAMLAAAHTAIGFGWGITHTEVKLTERGPVIVEINGRLGGDMIPLVARFATGIDPGAVAVDLALGRQPDLPGAPRVRAAHPYVGVRFAYPPEDCTVEAVELPADGVLAAAVLAEPGTRLRLPPAEFISRHAYVICAGRDPDDCTAALDAAMGRIRLTASPLRPVPTLTTTR
jgi:biotin carboxylase